MNISKELFAFGEEHNIPGSIMTALAGVTEGHGYELCVKDGALVRMDLCDGNAVCEDYSLRDAFLAASDWCSDLCEEAKRDSDIKRAEELDLLADGFWMEYTRTEVE